MRVIDRLSRFDKRLWSDVNIAGFPAGLKRYLLALIAVLVMILAYFDWVTHEYAYFAPLSAYKPIVDVLGIGLLVLTIASLLGLAIFWRSRVSE